MLNWPNWLPIFVEAAAIKRVTACREIAIKTFGEFTGSMAAERQMGAERKLCARACQD